MTGDEYIELAEKTTNPETDHYTHYVLGVSSEAGEMANGLKREIAYGKTWDPVNILEESGDLAWYLANILRLAGLTWEEVWEANIKKLKARYPEGFTREAALERNLDREYEVLSGEDS